MQDEETMKNGSSIAVLEHYFKDEFYVLFSLIKALKNDKK